MPTLQDLGLTMVSLTPSNVMRGDLSGIAIDPVLSWVAPGGCAQCRFKIARSILLEYPDLVYGLDLMVADSLGPIWRGRENRSIGNLDDSGEYFEVTAVGIAADDQSYDSHTFPAGTLISTAMETVRTDLLGAVGSSSSISGASYALAADVTMTDKKASSALNDLAALADGSVGVWWGIWASGDVNSSGLQLIVTPRTLGPSYVLPDQYFKGKRGWDGSQYGNRQKIRYNAGGSVAMVEDAVEQARVGFVREAPLLTRNDLTNLADAQAAATVALNIRKVLRLRSEQVTITAPDGIRDMNGQAVPLWRVWPPNVLAIEGPQPAFLSSYDLSRNAVTIVRSEYAVATGALTLSFESLDASLMGMLGKLWRQQGLG